MQQLAKDGHMPKLGRRRSHSMPPRITTVSHDAFAVLFYVVMMRLQEKATNINGNGYRTM